MFILLKNAKLRTATGFTDGHFEELHENSIDIQLYIQSLAKQSQRHVPYD